MSKDKDLKEVEAIDKFSKTEAGTLIIKKLNKEVNDMLFQFVAQLQKPDLNKYIALSCELKEKLNLINTFTKAGDLRQVIEDSLE